MDEKSNPTPPTNAIARRELLKALTAASSALAVAAFLPARWDTPVLETGVLPAHAQSSTELLIFSTTVTPLTSTPDASQNGLPEYRAEFSYHDDLGMINDNSKLTANVDGCGVVYDRWDIDDLPAAAFLPGSTGYDGRVAFQFAVCSGTFQIPGPRLTIVLAEGGRLSNQDSALIPF